VIRDDVERGMQATWSAIGLPQEQLTIVVETVLADAVVDMEDRHALVVVPDSGKLVYFDLFKAVTAIAGVLAAGLTLATGVAPVAALSAVAALGSLQGLRRPLPGAAGRIVCILMESPGRTLSREKLKAQFIKSYGPMGADDDFGRALLDLQSVKATQEEKGKVTLAERILLRL
jgi:hypothetical protein